MSRRNFGRFFFFGAWVLISSSSCSHLKTDLCATDSARVRGYEDADAGKSPMPVEKYTDVCGNSPETLAAHAEYSQGYARRTLEVCSTEFAAALGKEAAQRYRIEPVAEAPFSLCGDQERKMRQTFEAHYVKELCQSSVLFAAGADHGRRLEATVGPLLAASCPAERKVDLTKSYLAGYSEGLTHACSVTELYVKGLEHAKEGQPLSAYLGRLERCPEPTRFDSVTAYTSGYEQSQFPRETPAAPNTRKAEPDRGKRLPSGPLEDRG